MTFNIIEKATVKAYKLPEGTGQNILDSSGYYLNGYTDGGNIYHDENNDHLWEMTYSLWYSTQL